MSTIRQVFGLSEVTVFQSRHAIDANVVEANRPVGVEIELENLPGSTKFQFPGFRFEPDGSLRASDGTLAMEAITEPTPISAIHALLDIFYKKFGITERNFSERCSIHVHFNVLDLTVEQLASICLVYQTVERLLFTFVHPDRSKSIFCVPWYESGLTYNYVNSIIKEPGKVRRWQKYTALNLIPVGEQGTLEFRHMQGCADVGTIYQWIRIIARIFQYVQSKNFETIQTELLEMNTVSNYRQWLGAVFQGEADLFYGIPDFEKALFRGVVDSKYMLTQEKEQPRLSGIRWDYMPPQPEEVIHDDILERWAPRPVREVIQANNITVPAGTYFTMNAATAPQPAPRGLDELQRRIQAQRERDREEVMRLTRATVNTMRARR